MLKLLLSVVTILKLLAGTPSIVQVGGDLMTVTHGRVTFVPCWTVSEGGGGRMIGCELIPGEREGERKGWREGERKGRREEGSEGGREREREGRREGGERKGGKERDFIME